MAGLFVDVYSSKAKLTIFRDCNYFWIASMVNAYSFRQMLLRVVADGSTRSACNALYDECSSGFDIVFHVIKAKINSNMR